MDLDRTLPKSRVEVLEHRTKTVLLGAARLARWIAEPESFPGPVSATGDYPHALFERRYALERNDAAAIAVFEAGKRVNVALAAPSFDGIELTPSRPLSFWRTLGRVTRSLGYRDGMELRGGCIVPALGGGLCIISNALFELAAHAGFKVIERHGHTVDVGLRDTNELWGLDATVFYPYIDLRIAPPSGRVRLTMRVVGASLVVAAHGTTPGIATSIFAEDDHTEHTPTGSVRRNRIVRIARNREGTVIDQSVIARNSKRLVAHDRPFRSCLSCGETNCHDRPSSVDMRLRERPYAQGDVG